MLDRLTLFELNTQIRDVLQDEFAATVWIISEISEIKENRSGHCYLDLIEKDENSDEIIARARATIWSYTWRIIKSYFETTTGQSFVQGIKVLMQVAVEFHPAYGFSLNVKDIDPTYTLGDLARRRREIIDQLETTGVAEMNKELPLPIVAQRIAIISSATAAGYQDFVNQLENNAHGFRFEHTLFEAYMQGSSAVGSILNVLDKIYIQEQNFDVVVIIRGGGAAVDLNCFDNFDLAYAVAQFPLPVITGIGHEKDDTIVDMVAHTRMKTPTAVAEFLYARALRFYEMVIDREEQLVELSRNSMEAEQHNLLDMAGQISRSTGKYIDAAEMQLLKITRRLQNGTTTYSFERKEILNRIRHRFLRKTSVQMQSIENELVQLKFKVGILSKLMLKNEKKKWQKTDSNLSVAAKSFLTDMEKRITSAEDKLRILNPDNILKRGFSISVQEGKIVKKITDISEKSPLEIRFIDGLVKSEIIKKQLYGNTKKDDLSGSAE